MEPSESEKETVECRNLLFSEEIFHQSFQFVYRAGRLLLPSSKKRSFSAYPSNLMHKISAKTVDDE